MSSINYNYTYNQGTLAAGTDCKHDFDGDCNINDVKVVTDGIVRSQTEDQFVETHMLLFRIPKSRD